MEIVPMLYDKEEYIETVKRTIILSFNQKHSININKLIFVLNLGLG